MSVTITIGGANSKSSIIHESPSAQISSEASTVAKKYGEGIWQVFYKKEETVGVQPVPSERCMYLRYDYVNGVAQKLLYATDSKVGEVMGDGVSITSKDVILEFFKKEKLWNMSNIPGILQPVMTGEEMPDGTMNTDGLLDNNGNLIEEFTTSYLTEYDTPQTFQMEMPIPYGDKPTTTIIMTYTASKCNFTKHYDATYLFLTDMNDEGKSIIPLMMPGSTFETMKNKWSRLAAGDELLTITTELVDITAADLANLPYGKNA